MDQKNLPFDSDWLISAVHFWAFFEKGFLPIFF